MISALLVDARYALRQLRRFPGLSLVAVVSLALGIGANTALFELAIRVLFRPLDVSQPERLVSVVDGDAASARWHENSYREYVTYRDHNGVFSGVAASSETSAGLTAGDLTRLVTVSTVSRNFFGVIGVTPSVGRGFTGADVPSGSGDAQAVLGYALWANGFGGDRSIIGRTVRLNGTPFTVIGVAPRGFNGVGLDRIDIWVPLHGVLLLATGSGEGSSALTLENDYLRWLRVTGRIKSGVTVEQAHSNIVAVRSGIPYPKEYLPADGRMPTSLVSTVSTVALLDSDAGTFVLLLTGVVAFTLLIACANLATLLLAAGTARAQELGVRIALGAGRARLVRQLVTESTLLALLGGAAGVLVASWTGDLLRSFRSSAGLAFEAVVPQSGLGTALVATGLALFASMLIGLTPALAVTARDPAASLGTRHRTETPGQSRLRGWLMAVQIALALVLLTGAGLFGRSLRNALALDLGFEVDRLGIVGFNLGQQRYDSARAATFYAALLDRARATPGIRRAALASRVPVRAAGARSSAWVERASGPENLGEQSFNVVTPGYFATLGIPLVRGRDFSERDGGRAPGVVIVNEAFADRAWPGENPIGKRFWFGGPESPSLQVIGVARNSKYRSLRENGLPYYYLPLEQNFGFAGLHSSVRLAFRGSGETEQSIATIRALIRSLDPALPLFQAESARSQLSELLTAQRMGTTILSLLSAIGLLLALSGLYGVVSYAVTRRTREIGLRIALGAQTRDVLRLMLGQGMRPVIGGAVAGAAIVLALGRVAKSFMFGIAPGDPATLALAALLLLAVCIVAMLTPAVRATRIEPTQALREE